MAWKEASMSDGKDDQPAGTTCTKGSSASTKRESNWPHVLFYIHIHLLALYGIWLLFTEVKFLTIVFLILLCLVGSLGVTAGAHRLWAHRTYVANTRLRILLMLCQTLAGQGTIFDWVVDHRQHHKYYGTDGDPYNYNKGFAYSHLFTNFTSLSPYQQELKKTMDTKDLEEDSVVMFQKRFYYWLLYPVVFVLLPVNAPVEYWGESILNSFFVLGFLRYAIVLHAAWLVNSANLVWGLKPGDKYPADTNMIFILTKSYWPQYHYMMPWDYKSGEYGSYGTGCSTTLIRIWAALGWATQLRTIDSDTVKKALSKCVNTGKDIADCIQDAEQDQVLDPDHFLVHNSF